MADLGLRTQVITAAADLEALAAVVPELVAPATHDAEPEPIETLNLASAVHDVAERFRITTQRDLIVHTTRTIVQGRPRMITRALTNLLNNADKYSPPSEPIELYQTAGRLEVHDRGPGIRSVDQPYIFDRIFRSPIDQAKTGSGIGLAIVKQTAGAPTTAKPGSKTDQTVEASSASHSKSTDSGATRPHLRARKAHPNRGLVSNQINIL